MDNFRNAAKAFIVDNQRLLMLKRRPNDPHKPGSWDIPGGRLEMGENPYTGLSREIKEETGAEITIIMPIDVRHFTRDDGQTVTLTIYLCKLLGDKIVLSEEHTEYRWVHMDDERDIIPEFFLDSVNNFKQYLNHGKIRDS